MSKLDGKTLNIEEQNINKLKELFPEVNTDGKIDFEKLKQVLGDYVDDSDERYRTVWNGKGEALRLSQTPSMGTLRPAKEEGESKDWDNTQNLYIEGDNLEVLKLLQKSYFNKVKMIYIDPPYNTGNDFVYTDKFKDNIKNYKKITGQIDGEGKATSTNQEHSGRYHTDWMNMMYPRLRLARNLLTDDGVIFISLDDNESTNMIKICDEIFGEDNRVALICHKARASISNDKIISPNHNTIMFYAKNITELEKIKKMIGLDPVLDNFKLDDNDGKGQYRLVPVDGPGGAKKGNPFFEFMGVTGYFRFSMETMRKKYEEGLIIKKGNSLYQKYFKSLAEKTRKTDTTWWDDGGLTSSATSKLKELIGGGYFNNPKPLELLTRMLKLITYTDKSAIVLDFFSGSSTTAHATMQLNTEDEGDRKYIMVQLPELTDEKDDAYKAGYENIAEIGKERIRRSGDKIKLELQEKYEKATEEEKKDMKNPNELDIGFKVFKLDSSNIKEWNPGKYDDLQVALEDSLNPYVEGRTEEDVVYEMILKMGLDLTYPVRKHEVNGKTVYSVGYGLLMICLSNDIDLSVAKKMVEIKNDNGQDEFRVIFRDGGFNSDKDKTNIKETLKSSGLAEEAFITL